jgi:beta-lactamase regulating signal transducer with metallopeptidase domain
MNIFASPLPIVIELLMKSAALITGAALLSQAIRRMSAARRHLVWIAVFAALLILPLTKLVTPRWSLPVQRPLVAPAAAPRVTMVATSPTRTSTFPDLPRGTVPITQSVASSRFPDWRPIAFCGWLAGCIALLGYRLLGSLQLARLKRDSIPLSDSRRVALGGMTAAEFGVIRWVDVRVGRNIRIPMTWGIWRPVFLLPTDAAAWTEEQFAAVLRHEFGHIVRHDYFTRLIAQLAGALYWPNPLVWLAARSLRLAQEQACDDLVLRGGTPPEEYAALLFDATRRASLPGISAHHAVAMARRATLEDRVLAIVDKSRDRRPAGWWGRVIIGFGTVAALMASAVAQIEAGFVTREYRVNKGFIVPVEDAYVSWNTGKGPHIKVYANVEEVLNGGYPDSIRYQRVKFPPGARINYDPQLRILRVHSTRANLALVESLLIYDGAIPLSALVRIDPTVLITKIFRLVPDFVVPMGGDRIRARNGGTYRNAQEFLMANQLEFPPGASAIYYPAEGPTLEVTNTPANLIAIQAFLDHEHSARGVGMAEHSALIAWNQEVTVEKTGDGLFVEEHIVDGDMIYRAKNGGVVGPGGRKYADVKALLIGNGIDFPRGASADLLYGIDQPYVLQVCNTPRNLDAIESFVSRNQALQLRKRDPQDAIAIAAAASSNNAAPSSVSSPSNSIMAKAQSIILPEFEFRNATIRECLDFLKRKSGELDPEKKGINIVLKETQDTSKTRISVGLRNVRFIEALRYVITLGNLQFRWDQEAITVAPLGDPRALITKEYRLPHDFFVPSQDGFRFGPAAPVSGPELVTKRGNAKELFTALGIQFPAGASATYVATGQKLIVRNTQENFDLIDQVIVAAAERSR